VGGREGRRVGWLPEAEAGGAGGPLAPAGALLEHLRAARLLRGRGLGGQSAAPDRLPGGHRELVQAVVETVRADDRRVTTRLALGQRGPHAAGGRGPAGVTGGAGITPAGAARGTAGRAR